MKYRIKLFVEFILWEIRRIIRFIEKCFGNLPFLLLFILLYIIFTTSGITPFLSMMLSFSYTFMFYLIDKILQSEWDKFIEYKKWIKRKRK